MVSSEKPRSIAVILWDRKAKKQKSFTVYGSLNEAYRKVRRAFK